MWIALKNKNIVGMVALETHKSNETIGELRRMSVSNTIRRQNLGTQLLDTLITFAKDKNYKKIILSTSSLQIPAIRMYERYGFKIVKKRYDWKCNISFVDMEYIIQ
jgi:ribosomal protein S18 acetylase RimI-like enzyme